MGLGWEFTKGVFSASNSIGRSISGGSRLLRHSAAQRGAERRANRGARSVASGLIGPFDPMPPAHASGYLDYSGLATPGDIASEPWDFPLGKYVMPRNKWEGGEQLGIPDRVANRHTVVYAPTQIGKTTSIIAPWIYYGMRAGYLVVALDLKGNNDLRDKVMQFAEGQDPLPGVGFGGFDYTHPSGSVSWNWLDDLKDETSIEAAVAAIVGDEPESGHNREFRLRDMTWMKGLFEMVGNTGTTWTIRSLLDLLADCSRFELLVDRQRGTRAYSRLVNLTGLDEEEYYNKTQFLTTYLETLNINGFVSVTRHSQMKIDDLANDPGLFIVTAPIADGELSRAVSGLFLGQFLNRQYRKFNRGGRPVLLVLDEAPRLKDRLDLKNLMTTSASSGMSVLLAIQEVTDFNEKERDVVLANCGTHILLGGAGHKTTEYFGHRLGNRVVARQTQSESYTRRDGRTWQSGIQTMEVPVLGRAELAHPPSGPYSGFIHCQSLSRKPILVDFARDDLT